MISRVGAISVLSLVMALPAAGQETIGSTTFVANGQSQSITQAASTTGAPTSRYFLPTGPCDDFCIAPDRIHRSISNASELEVLDFLTATVANGQGLLIDARMEDARARGFIAGSINMPHALLAEENPFAKDILVAMGAAKTDSSLNFDNVLPVIVFDDGPTTNDAQKLVEALVLAGYPAGQIRYYRGGMLMWSAVGLSIAVP